MRVDSGRRVGLGLVSLMIAVALGLGAAGAAEQPPIRPSAAGPLVVGAGDVTIHDIAGTSTLVTVEIADTGALDENLRIAEAYDTHFTVLSQDNVPGAFLFSLVKAIHVQGGKVETKRFVIDESRTLRPEEQKVVERAFARAEEVFNASNDSQSVKMNAAVLLALNGHEQARHYLELLAANDDLQTALQAVSCLFLAGSPPPIEPSADGRSSAELLRRGLASGSRRIKAEAAVLSGLLRDTSSEDYLMAMLQDRSVERANPAARALARLGNRECIPSLLRMLTELDDARGEAAIFALSHLNGPDVAEQMKVKYESSVGAMQFRIARVLYNIGDPLGRELLVEKYLAMPTLAEDAALILAREGHFESMDLLRARLGKQFDPTEPWQALRARAAIALIAGGDPSPISVLQDLLRSDNPRITVMVCNMIAALGKRQLLPITQPPIESPNPDIALAACRAAIAIANPNDFRERLVALQL